MNKGVLYLIPVPIHSENEFEIKLIPPYIIEIINNIKVFAVENIRTSRRFIKKINKEYDINDTEFIVIDKRANESVYAEIINKRFFPTDRGKLISAFLEKLFSKYVDYNFTAELENQLDDITTGKENRYTLPILYIYMKMIFLL